METTTRLCPQGEWGVKYRGVYGVAQCLELEGFGIVGGVIDEEGSSIILDRAIAYSDLLDAAQRALPWIGKLIAEGVHLKAVAPNDAIGAMHDLEAAIAKAKGGA